MKNLIKETVLNSQDTMSFIADSDVIAEVAIELLDDGVEFVETDLSDILAMVKENDILAIEKNVYSDNTIEYFIEKIFDEEGFTLEDNIATVYIQSDLVDCVDLEAFEKKVIIVELDECCDCKYCNCYSNECSEEDIQQLLVDHLNYALKEISEIGENNDEMVYDRILELLNEVFDEGYELAIADLEE